MDPQPHHPKASQAGAEGLLRVTPVPAGPEQPSALCPASWDIVPWGDEQCRELARTGFGVRGLHLHFIPAQPSVQLQSNVPLSEPQFLHL